MGSDDGIGLAMTIASAISIAASGSIILAFTVLPALRTKPYMTVVFYVAISDMLNGFGSSVGLPAGGSPSCWFEGVVTNIFSLASVLWTVVISLMMYEIIAKGKVLEIGWLHHCVCWGLPIVVTFIPLATGVTYSNPDGWCWLAPTKHMSAPWVLDFWNWANFYGIIWGGVGIMMLIFLKLLNELRTNVHVATKRLVKRVFRKLLVYPFILIISWLLTTVSDLYVSDHPDLPAFKNAGFQYLTAILPCLQGFFTSAVFWKSNAEVRQAMLLFLSGESKYTVASSNKSGADRSIVSEINNNANLLNNSKSHSNSNSRNNNNPSRKNSNDNSNHQIDEISQKAHEESKKHETATFQQELAMLALTRNGSLLTAPQATTNEVTTTTIAGTTTVADSLAGSSKRSDLDEKVGGSSRPKPPVPEFKGPSNKGGLARASSNPLPPVKTNKLFVDGNSDNLSITSSEVVSLNHSRSASGDSSNGVAQSNSFSFPEQIPVVSIISSRRGSADIESDAGISPLNSNSVTGRQNSNSTSNAAERTHSHSTTRRIN